MKKKNAFDGSHRLQVSHHFADLYQIGLNLFVLENQSDSSREVCPRRVLYKDYITEFRQTGVSVFFLQYETDKITIKTRTQ